VPARTTPRSVVTVPRSIRRTRVRSWTVTPCRSAASARPRTSRAGCSAAQCGLYVPPSTPDAPQIARAAAASRTVCPAACSRRNWAGVRASDTVPPLAKWQSMPSAAAARPTSSTVSSSAACIAGVTAAGNRAEHQPPLRPDAPKPQYSASSTTIRRSGAARAR
jgi:hypothetical protein